MDNENVNRRNFFKKSAAGMAGAGVVFSDISKNQTAPSIFIPKYPNPEDYKVKKYRSLGKLGFKASDISIGTTGMTDPSIISFALDCGVNYIDTAYIYGNGKAERDIGLALRGKRDGLWINTKFNDPAFKTANAEKALMDSLDESLRRLKTDYVDSIMVHAAKPAEFLSDDLHSMFAKAKQAGKVKYLGISSHSSDAIKIFEQIITDERFDLILIVYGIFSSQSTEKVFKQAYDEGKAVIAMKTLGAAYNARINRWDTLKSNLYDVIEYSPAFLQSAIAWVLKNPYISIMVKRMNSIDDVKNCLSASGTEFGAVHQKFLDHYGNLIEGNYCKIGCGECLSSCPNQVAINEIMRYKMYFENYGSEKEGIVCYNNLHSKERADTCTNCNGDCSGSCPAGVDVRKEMIRAHELLSV